jgi:hypothetical protein
MTITVTFDVPDASTDTSAEVESKCTQIYNSLNTWTAEANAMAIAQNFNATNSTSVTTWTVANYGSQAFVIEAGKSYVVGMTVKVASTVSGQNWGLGDVTAASSGSITIQFRVKNGTGTFSAWTISQNANTDPLQTTRSARTSNTIIGVADVGKLIDITSGTFTQTFDAAATLKAGFFCRIKNSGTGDITLDPNAAETIDGRTTFIMFPGECRDIYCDGSNLFSVVLNPFFRRITTTYASMPIPPGYTRFGVRIWSGGASGQRNNNVAAISRGGAGGGCVDAVLAASAFATTETVTIGAGGAAVTTVANGNVGGDSTFGALVTAFAGNSWIYGGSCFDGFSGTAQYVSELVYCAHYGATASTVETIFGGGSTSSDSSAAAAPSLYGGGAGGSLNASAVVRAPGTSTFGGSGGAASSVADGTAGSQPGGGGGATQTGTSSGAGGSGQCDFWGMI